MHRKSLDSHGLVVGTIDGEIEAGVVIEDGDAQDKPLHFLITLMIILFTVNTPSEKRVMYFPS